MEEQRGISIMFVKQLVHFPIHLTERGNVRGERKSRERKDAGKEENFKDDHYADT